MRSVILSSTVSERRMVFFTGLTAASVLFFALAGRLPAADKDESVFGESTQSDSALVGVLYDLKQTQEHTVPTGDNDYAHVIDRFIFEGWNESLLNKYYRVSKPLYTTQVFIPNMDANNAPKAFNAEKHVKPSCWVIIYKGQVSPPSAGTYRFWGAADDALAVAVDGKTVLVGNRFDTPSFLVKWKSSEPDGAQASDDLLRAGDWFTLKAGQIIDLDVLVGERPGGLFNAFLLVEKQGDTYEKDAAGHPTFPIFQVAPYDTPMHNDVGQEPKFAKGYPIWTCHQ